MPQDFDPDEFMSRRRKPTQPKTPTGDFDPDAFMAGRRQPQQPKRLPATINPEFSLTEGLGAPVQPQAKRPRPSAEEELLGYDRFREEKRRRDEARAEADLLRYDPAGYSEGRPLTPQREAFSRKPFLERKFERTLDELRAGGLDVSRMARRTLGAAAGLVRAADLNPATTPEMVDFPEWRRDDEERMRHLAERERARPPMSLGEEIGAGIVRGVPTAGAAIGLGTLTGGGALPTMAIGGGMGAAGADWSNPKRAAAETALGAVAPVVGGKIGQRVGGVVAGRLARPAAQTAARAGGEVVGGGAANVLQSAALGERSPRELFKSAAIGGGLTVPGAVTAARRPVSGVSRQNAPADSQNVAAPRVSVREGMLGAETAPQAPQLPSGVRVIRAGEPIPPRERGQRQIPMDVERPDGSVETVLVISPDRINGRRADETTLRPMAEQALKPAAQPEPVTTTGAETAPPRPQPPEAKGRIVRVGDKDFTLTPEQEARWKTEIDDAIADAKRYADQWRQSDPQRAGSILKGRMMALSAKKREIVGAFTPKEEAAQAAREKTNYRGKSVSVDINGQRVNATVEGMSFGRVRVKLEDGRQMTADRSQVGAPVEPPVIPNPRNTRGAIIAQPSSLPSRKLLPPGRPEDVPTEQLNAPLTRRITVPQPDAPITQEMPAFRRRIEAENAPTAELPAVAVRQPQQPPRPRTERLPVPKVTPENIDALRQRQEELGRLAYDRRGDFTGDLRDEYNQLTARIRDYDNQRAPQELAPPPGTQPGRMVPPTGEIPARRRALDLKTRFASREDERQGHFERFDDAELVDEIRRMEEQRNLVIRGKSRLTPEQREANEFDLKIAVEMQKERGRIQRGQGREPEERIAPRTPGRPPRKVEATTETPATGLEGLRQYAKSLKEGEKPNAVRAVAAFLGRRPASMADTNTALKAIQEAGYKDVGDFVRSARGPKAEVKRVEDAPFNYVLLADGTVQVSTGGRFEPNPTPEVVATARKKLGLPPSTISEVKQPWQMTRQEFERAADTEWFKGKRWFNKPQQLANARREVVQQAMEDGKPVPPEVLAEYPELQPKVAETGRKIQHSQFGEVSESPDQSGVRKGQLRVVDEAGNPHIIRNPRIRGGGNQNAAFIKSTGAIPAEAMPELRAKNAPPSPLAGKRMAAKTGPRTDYAIPAEAMPELRGREPAAQIVQRMAKLAYSPTSPVEISKLRAEFPNLSKEAFDAEMLKLAEEGRVALHRHDYVGSLSEAERAKLVKEGNNYFVAATFRERPGTVMGSGLGALQGLFERGGKPKTPVPEPQPGDLTRRERMGRKIGTLQTGAQLLNPKTIIQNVIGNAAFSGVKNAATFAAIPVDKFLSAFTKQRQVATPELRTQFRDFVDGFTDIYHAVKSKDYAALADNRYELSNERVFKGKVGGFVEDVLNITLRGPDRGGFLAAYNDSVQQILKAHAKSKTKFSLDKIHEQAKMEAQQAVFQDSNKLSDFTVGLRNLINKFSPFGEKANFGLADFVGLKYPKTPANLVMRGIEYSPAGFAKAIFKSAKVLAGKGKGFDQREASLAFGKAFVGTLGGSGLGALLFAMGVITQPEQENRGVQAAERGEGLMGYQVNLSALWRYAFEGGLLDALTGDVGAGKKQAGDVLMSYDWFQPWAFSLSMGAAAMRAAGKEKTDMGALDETLTQIDAVNSTLTDQSILRNINDAFKYGLKSTARKAVTDAPASFVPSVLNQARQVIDDRAREVSKEKGISGVKREAFEKVVNRLPGASRRLPEKQDVVGRPVPSRMAGAAGAALVPVPGRFARFDPHPVLTEMQATGSGATGIRRKDDETEEQFRARRAKAAGWRDQYGRTLTASPAYKSATPELRKAAMDQLEETISKQSGERRPSLYLLRPSHVLATVRRAAREAERKRRREAAAQ